MTCVYCGGPAGSSSWPRRFGHKLLKEVYDLLAEAKKDLVECTGALVVRGNGRVLSSGFDLQTMGAGPAESLPHASCGLHDSYERS
eukprot:5922350-Amphidinium_carterae.2